MAVVVVLAREDEVPSLLAWSLRFAAACGEDLVAVHPALHPEPAEARVVEPSGGPDGGGSTGNPVLDAALPFLGQARPAVSGVEDAESAGAGPRPSLVLRRHPDPVQAVLDQLSESSTSLLILSKPERQKGEDATQSLERQLFLRAPCDTLLLRLGGRPSEPCGRILVPTTGGPHATAALTWAAHLAGTSEAEEPVGCEVDALYVQPEVGADTEAVGRRVLARGLARAGVDRAAHVNARVAIAPSFSEGLARTAAEGYDLVLVGANNLWFMRRVLFGVVPGELLSSPSGPTIGVMRCAFPLTTRFQQRLTRLLESVIPQLGREGRIALVERVQSHSEWSFDFVALMGLATLIAAMGLIRDSGAVVIGAMLVAPLMTPLIGGGLALVQDNPVLIRHAVRSVVYGFLLAFGLGCLLGWGVPGVEVSGEMSARGSPAVLDLAVAFVSGVAAAYATSRPNLLSALPGVAIAASLVPPIATGGLALALGELALAAGAVLLFLTNIVAILIGAAGALYAVGVRSEHVHATRRGRRLARRAVPALGASLIALIAALGYPIYDPTPHAGLPPEGVEALRGRVQEVPGARWLHARRLHADATADLVVTIQSPAPLDPALADELAALAQPFLGRPCRLRVVTQLVSEGASDGG